jgi:hypothetical protein
VGEVFKLKCWANTYDDHQATLNPSQKTNLFFQSGLVELERPADFTIDDVQKDEKEKKKTFQRLSEKILQT